MIINLGNWRKIMINKYIEKFMVWQLHYRTEIVCVIAGFIVGAIIF